MLEEFRKKKKGIYLERCLVRILQGNLTVLSEQMQVLKIVLLQVLHDVVHMNGTDHQTEGKDCGAVLDSTLRVKSSLSVHQQNTNLSK